MKSIPESGGFTIFEVLVVLAIIGITAAIVVPRFDLMSVRVNATSRSVASFLAAAQQRAILAQRNVLVTFDSAGGFYTGNLFLGDFVPYTRAN